MEFSLRHRFVSTFISSSSLPFSSGLLRRAGVVLTVFLSLLLLSPASQADELRINDVAVGKLQLSVEGLEGTTFEGCTTVKVSKKGVDISCPGYDLSASIPDQNQEVASDPDAIPTLTQRYWVIPNQNVAGMTHYDIDLYINGKWIRRFRNTDDITALEVTKHLSPGENRFLFVSTKRDQGKAEPGSEEHFFRLVVGEGESRAGRVLIERPLFEVRRLASEVKDFTEERKLITR